MDNVVFRNFVQLEYTYKGRKMYFVGKDETGAKDELNKWLDWTSNRSKNVQIASLPLKDKGFSQDTLMAGSHENVPVASGNAPHHTGGKGASLIGKVWMIHHKDRLRARVAAIEVSAYEAKGYVRGGPKTKFI